MKTIKVDESWLSTSGIKAVIRIADGNRFFRFFDKKERRLCALLEVVSNCEVIVRYISTQPELMLCLEDPEDWDNSSNGRRAEPNFYREVVRVGLLIEKFAKLIDTHSNLVIDYPRHRYLLGKVVTDSRVLLEELEDKTGDSPTLSESVPKELHRKMDEFISLVVPPEACMLGSCHSLWRMKKMILQYGFNLKWLTPAEEHPDVLFD